MARASQIPTAPRASASAHKPAVDRPSTPKMTLVRPAAAARGTRFSAVKGEAPGGYHAGPAVLPRGARVGILSDTLYGDREVRITYQAGLEAACELVERLGLTPVIDPLQRAVTPYFERWAGSVQERAAHFVRLLDTYQVDAVFPLFGKGGYHAVVDAVAASSYRPARPVALIGGFSHHSDWSLFGQSTRGQAFFSHLLNTTQCAYWKMLPQANIDNLSTILRHAAAVEYEGLRPLNARAHTRGTLEGRLGGGNLSAILRNLHKPWFPDFGGRIVMCEDYDSPAHEIHYRVTEFLREAEQRGACAAILGAILPARRPLSLQVDPTQRKAEADREHAEIAAILDEAAGRVNIPVFHHSGIFGHGAMNYPLGFGGRARISMSGEDTARLYNELKVQP